MDIPVQFRAGVEAVVDFREEVRGETGGEVAPDEVVGYRCEEDFVDVEGEGGEV